MKFCVFIIFCLSIAVIYAKRVPVVVKSDLELLLDAIEKDNAEDVEKYANSENIHYVNNKGQTPLHLACGKDNLMMVQTLLNKGAKVNVFDNSHISPIFMAAFRDNRDIVDLFIKNGADVNAETYFKGWTPLYTAAVLGYEDLTNLLLQNGAKVDQWDYDGKTPLIAVSSMGGNLKILVMLLKAGADKTRTDDTGRTALDHARNRGFELVAELLTEGIVMETTTQEETPETTTISLDQFID